MTVLFVENALCVLDIILTFLQMYSNTLGKILGSNLIKQVGVHGEPEIVFICCCVNMLSCVVC